MTTLLDLLTGLEQPLALVTVAGTKGSAPREAGARMAVTPHTARGTIGGGHLEYAAIVEARDLLADEGPEAWRELELALGPELEQCCGGRVTLIVERIDAAFLAALAGAAAGAAAVTPLLPGGTKTIDSGGTAPACAAIINDGGRRLLVDPLSRPGLKVALFGAGHVGRAVAQALAPVVDGLQWFDSRALDPGPRPGHVHFQGGTGLHEAAKRVPPGAWWLVMTHSHQLDLEICEQALVRDDFAYLGLIGSVTKRARFVGRLRARDIGRAALDRLTCPIGIGGIDGKEPATIAVSVAAEIVTLWEAGRRGQLQPAQTAGADAP